MTRGEEIMWLRIYELRYYACNADRHAKNFPRSIVWKMFYFRKMTHCGQAKHIPKNDKEIRISLAKIK